MSIKNRKVKSNEKLRFRPIGSGFIMTEAMVGMPVGRKLTKTFADQFDRTYVQVNGNLEAVTEQHGYLGAE